MDEEKRVEPKTISFSFFYNNVEKKVRAYHVGDDELVDEAQYQVYKKLHEKYRFKLEDELHGVL